MYDIDDNVSFPSLFLFCGWNRSAPASPAKVDKAIETEPMTEDPPTHLALRTIKTPPLVRNETEDSVEIVCDVLA